MSGIGRGHGYNRGVALGLSEPAAENYSIGRAGQLGLPVFCAGSKFQNFCSASGGRRNSLKMIQETWELAD